MAIYRLDDGALDIVNIGDVGLITLNKAVWL